MHFTSNFATKQKQLFITKKNIIKQKLSYQILEK